MNSLKCGLNYTLLYYIKLMWHAIPIMFAFIAEIEMWTMLSWSLNWNLCHIYHTTPHRTAYGFFWVFLSLGFPLGFLTGFLTWVSHWELRNTLQSPVFMDMHSVLTAMISFSWIWLVINVLQVYIFNCSNSLISCVSSAITELC